MKLSESITKLMSVEIVPDKSLNDLVWHGRRRSPFPAGRAVGADELAARGLSSLNRFNHRFCCWRSDSVGRLAGAASLEHGAEDTQSRWHE